MAAEVLADKPAETLLAKKIDPAVKQGKIKGPACWVRGNRNQRVFAEHERREHDRVPVIPQNRSGRMQKPPMVVAPPVRHLSDCEIARLRPEPVRDIHVLAFRQRREVHAEDDRDGHALRRAVQARGDSAVVVAGDSVARDIDSHHGRIDRASVERDGGVAGHHVIDVKRREPNDG